MIDTGGLNGGWSGGTGGEVTLDDVDLVMADLSDFTHITVREGEIDPYARRLRA